MSYLFADGFEKAIIGIAQRCGEKPIVCYDREKCIRILMKRDKIAREDAEEFFSVNTEEAWVGKQTPIFIERMDLADIQEACLEEVEYAE